MKHYTIIELVEYSYNDLSTFAGLEDHFQIVSRLTEKKEYSDIYFYLKKEIIGRLRAQICDTIFIFAKVAEYKIESEDYFDEDGDERERHILIFDGERFSLEDAPYRLIRCLIEKDADPDDIDFDLNSSVRVIESEAYKVICRAKEAFKLDYELTKKEDPKEGIFKKLINKI